MRCLLAVLFILTIGPAHAAFLSADNPTASLVLSFLGPSSSISLDLNGDGTPDVTLSTTQGQSIVVDAGTAGVSWSGFYATPFASTDAFVTPNGPGFTTAAAPIVNIVNGQLGSDWPVDPGFLEVTFNADGTQALGYIDAYLALNPGANDATLTIEDFGFNTAIPEPATPPILLTAVAATILFSRRQPAKPGSPHRP